MHPSDRLYNVSMTQALKRITTTYIDVEDRMRLSGENSAGELVVIWLPRRLLNLLVTSLLTKLGANPQDSEGSQLMQEFAQHSAVAGLQPEAPIIPPRETTAWLTTSIDIIDGVDGVGLVFKDHAHEASLSLDRTELRQWLSILFKAYRTCGWQENIWPSWFDSHPPTHNVIH